MQIRHFTHRTIRLAGAALLGAALLVSIGCGDPEPRSQRGHPEAAYEVTTQPAQEQLERTARTA